jgi:hypothetical protein
MAQTSIDWIYVELSMFINGNSVFETPQEVLSHALKMHKVECLSFAEEWEIRCNEKDMDSKEQLYDETYNK